MEVSSIRQTLHSPRTTNGWFPDSRACVGGCVTARLVFSIAWRSRAESIDTGLTNTTLAHTQPDDEATTATVKKHLSVRARFSNHLLSNRVPSHLVHERLAIDLARRWIWKIETNRKPPLLALYLHGLPLMYAFDPSPATSYTGGCIKPRGSNDGHLPFPRSIDAAARVCLCVVVIGVVASMRSEDWEPNEDCLRSHVAMVMRCTTPTATSNITATMAMMRENQHLGPVNEIKLFPGSYAYRRLPPASTDRGWTNGCGLISPGWEMTWEGGTR